MLLTECVNKGEADLMSFGEKADLLRSVERAAVGNAELTVMQSRLAAAAEPSPWCCTPQQTPASEQSPRLSA